MNHNIILHSIIYTIIVPQFTTITKEHVRFLTQTSKDFLRDLCPMHLNLLVLHSSWLLLTVKLPLPCVQRPPRSFDLVPAAGFPFWEGTVSQPLEALLLPHHGFQAALIPPECFLWKELDFCFFLFCLFFSVQYL